MKKRIMLTGATGVMGSAGLREIISRSDRFAVTVLARDSFKNRRKLSRYADVDGFRIVWGDLTCYEDVAEAVRDADYVLHVGGMVSPRADYHPRTALRVNVTAAENIVRAVKARPDADKVKVVYIGSVAQTGDRRAPVHWGRTGDPLCPSIYDHYAVSKCLAERIFAESGLKYWVSLRQSGILYPDILKKIEPIMFHVPLRGVFEWATVEDSGRLLANVCEDGVPDDFWNRFYNISSGNDYRLTNYRFESLIMKSISCPAPERIFKTKWFALGNFHGQWYLDSDRLEEILHFRGNVPVEEYFARMSRTLPWYYSLARFVPAFVIRSAIGLLTRNRRFGTMHWVKSGDASHVSAYFGSRERWNAIPDWNDVTDMPDPASDRRQVLDHGYDESIPLSELSIRDMRSVAAFRGGKCLSDTMAVGDIDSPLEWECACGHMFKASPVTVLLGGHWCPECFPSPWNYDAEARRNLFFAQVWRPLHEESEDKVYDDGIRH